MKTTRKDMASPCARFSSTWTGTSFPSPSVIRTVPAQGLAVFASGGMTISAIAGSVRSQKSGL